MNELKEVLAFISFSFRKFFANFLFFFAYFFFVIILTVLTFFFSNRSFDNYHLFMAYMVILAIAHLQMKRKFFLKRQLKLNLLFVDFLMKEDKADLKTTDTGDLLLKKMAETKAELKQMGSRFIFKKLLLTTIASRIRNESVSFSSEKLNKLKRTTFGYILINVIIFLILLVPFTLISFLFTRGFVPSIQFLIYLVGFLFVCFLNSAVFEPILFLIIQAETYRSGSGR